MKLDLAMGNPGFIQDIYQPEFYHPPMSDKYAYDTEIKDFLKTAIIYLHKSENNISDVEEYEVVVANGATQLLDFFIPRHQFVEMYAPYWSRFKGIANARKTQFYTRNDPEHSTITVYPNNPDFHLSYYNYYTNVVDACYHWPHYYRKSELKPLSGEVFLFSGSKLTGLAASRVGWALVRNKQVADELRDYVELTTSGVSVDGQVAMYNGITSYNAYKDNAKDILADRWDVLEYISKPLNSEGMFVLYNDPGHVFEKHDIVGVRGEAMGVSNDIIRLNIGCNEWQFLQLLPRIQKIQQEIK